MTAPPLPEGLRPGGRCAEWRPGRPAYCVADVDGTLLARGDRATPAVAAAVAEAEAAGIAVGVATGRPPVGVAPLIEQLRASGPHIVHDGAEVRVGDRPVRTWPLTAAERDALLALCDSRDLYCELWLRPDADGREPLVVTRRHPRARVHWDAVTGPPDAVVGEVPLGEVVKATVVVYAPDPAEPVIEALVAAGLRVGHSTSPVMPDLTFLNVTTPSADKGTALAAAAAYVGCGTEEVVAIGDGRNDVPLFAVAGTAVAMGQSAPEVIAAAHLVAPDVADDGVAAARAAATAWRRAGAPAGTAPATGGDGGVSPERPSTEAR